MDALPWALSWAPGPPLGSPLGPGGALRGSGPAGPWALVGPCRDRALSWALVVPCGDRALSGPQQIRKNSYFQRPKTLSISK